MSQTVIGIFENASEARDAVEQLVTKGFDRSAIDISTTASGDTTGSTTGYSSTGTGTASMSDNSSEGESKIGKFFKNLFGDDDDNNNQYSSYSRAAESRSVVTVHAQSADQADKAADILDDYGAINVDDDSSSSSSSSYGAADMGTIQQAGQSTGETKSIPVIEEQLQVGKKVVETGGVRLRSRIVERPVEESLRLREERVYVNRTPVNRPISGSELESFKEGTIEMTESAEVPVVAKEAYVKEEIRVGKEVSERDETIRDTVRSTEVEVENLKTDRTTNSDLSSGNYTTKNDL